MQLLTNTAISNTLQASISSEQLIQLRNLLGDPKVRFQAQTSGDISNSYSGSNANLYSSPIVQLLSKLLNHVQQCTEKISQTQPLEPKNTGEEINQVLHAIDNRSKKIDRDCKLSTEDLAVMLMCRGLITTDADVGNGDKSSGDTSFASATLRVNTQSRINNNNDHSISGGRNNIVADLFTSKLKKASGVHNNNNNIERDHILIGTINQSFESKFGRNGAAWRLSL